MHREFTFRVMSHLLTASFRRRLRPTYIESCRRASTTSSSILVRQRRMGIEQQGNSIVVTVQDNGRGFVPAAAGRAGGGVRSFGLSGIAERVRMLGGNYTVRSQPGQGTTIRMKISICRTVIRALQMKDEIRIVIADDHPVFRRGLRQIKSRRTHG